MNRPSPDRKRGEANRNRWATPGDPPKSVTGDGAPVEYLYVPCIRTRYNGHAPCAGCRRCPSSGRRQSWVYFTSDSFNWRKAIVGPGRISRQQFEYDTRHCERIDAVTDTRPA